MECCTIQLGDRIVGESHPCYIIAEAGINHNGSVERARQLVDAAVECGADAVKFQMRHLDQCYPAGLLKEPNLAEWGFHHILGALKDADLSPGAFGSLKDYCSDKEIEFLCTPWDIPSLHHLDSIGVRFFKVSSADLVNLPLIDAIADTGKAMILSTGMATEKEIGRTVEHLKLRNAVFALLHCVSAYPAPFDSLNMRFIETLRKFNVPVGYSGHERGISIPVVARVLGASIIEKHITLDRTLPGPDHASSLEPVGFKKMVRDIRVAEIALGRPEKRICQIEQINRHVLRKSLLATRDIAIGERVTRDMICVAGPGKGITPQRMDELLNVTVQRRICKDDYFVEGDLEPDPNIEFDRTRLVRKWGLKARFHDMAAMLDLKPDFIEMHLSEHDIDNAIPQSDWYPETDLFVHAPEFFRHRLLDLASDDHAHRAASADMIRRTADLAAGLAPRFRSLAGIVVHAGGMTMDEPSKERIRLMDRIINELHPLLAEYPMILPENLPPRPWYLGGQWFQNVMTQAEDMVLLSDTLRCRVTFDLSHAQLACTLAGTALSDFIDSVMPIAAHLHIADASGIDGEGLQIDEGIIDWDDTLKRLRNHLFTWLPEIWSGHLNGALGFRTALCRLIEHGGL
ncbi:N-acetylneuraminate synthase family protein [bacterium]|nr:N-acetylneuraminate synthase family protein [candidate division CSSED10-310 bacterium]